MYINRHIKSVLNKNSSLFPIVLLTGPRQVGKSTALKQIFSNLTYISCDNLRTVEAIKSDALGYLENKGVPIILDEAQQASEIFIAIKNIVDTKRKNGMYFLTGSQSFSLMQNVSESLAGRISIINLLGLSNREIYKDDFSDSFIPSSKYLKKRKPAFSFSNKKLWKRIFKGSMPELYANSRLETEVFFDAYVNTYIERDVRNLAQVGNLLTFRKFMVSCAARTGQLLNMADIAKDVGIDAKTVKHWLSILESAGIIYLLQPFFPNISKRIVKTPKLYFTDTGLVSYLCRWTSPETLENGAMNGAIFETFIVSEILKSYYNVAKKSDMYYFRNTDGQEVDIIFYKDNKIFPIEIKKHSTVFKDDFKNFATLKTYFPNIEIADGGVVCTSKELLPMGEKRWVIPLEMI